MTSFWYKGLTYTSFGDLEWRISFRCLPWLWHERNASPACPVLVLWISSRAYTEKDKEFAIHCISPALFLLAQRDLLERALKINEQEYGFMLSTDVKSVWWIKSCTSCQMIYVLSLFKWTSIWILEVGRFCGLFKGIFVEKTEVMTIELLPTHSWI